MKKTKLFILSALITLFLISCGAKSDKYDSLVNEYKKVLCIGFDTTNESMSEKTQALQRQQELNKELEKAYNELEGEEESKLRMKVANAMAEVSDGKCD